MPRRRKRMNGGSIVSQIRTANKDLRLQTKLLSAKPALQQPGQLSRKKQYGGSRPIVDKYGAYLYLSDS